VGCGCVTKAIRDSSMTVERGAHWAMARRARLIVEADRLVCRDWVIPFDSIREAKLQPYRGFAFSGTVLVVRTDEHAYQFGLSSWCHCLDELPLDTTSSEPMDLFGEGERARTWGDIVVGLAKLVVLLIVAQVALGVLFGSRMIAAFGPLVLLVLWWVFDARRELRKMREKAGSPDRT
jgi:hypothetical protein